MGLLKEHNNRRFGAPWDVMLRFVGAGAARLPSQN
jgi:hypothetical protein